MEQDNSRIESTQNWTIGQKIAFRFSALFFTLHIFPFPLDSIPFVNYENNYTEILWNIPVQWTGRLFFGIPEITSRPMGSGDTTWNWVQEFLFLALSVIGSLAWSWLDRRRANYNKAHYILDVYVRYYLAMTLFSYGTAKVFPSQFGTLLDFRLYERYGDMSPMGVLWSFMAASTPYQFVTGMVECIAGLLIFFRRTTLLGSIIALVAMVQIFALNMCYDVPVKLYSFLLLLMSIYLMSPSFGQLFRFFFANKPTEPRVFTPFLDKKWYRISRIGLKYIFIVTTVGSMFWGQLSLENKEKPPVKNGLLNGSYEVKTFENFTQTARLDNDTTRWQEAYFMDSPYGQWFLATNNMGYRQGASLKLEDSTQTIFLARRIEKDTMSFHYERLDSTTLVLTGKWGKDSLRVAMQKMPERTFLLKSRGFHWINEVPLNK